MEGFPGSQEIRNMKVLHVTTELDSGAGQGAVRLHYDLVSAGVDSRVLSLSGMEDDQRITSLLKPGQSRKRRFRDIPSSLLHRIGIFDSAYYRAKKSLVPLFALSGTIVSSPFTRIDIRKHPLVESADVIHLHWVANFIDWPSFFPTIRKPIIWTMRDENPALGFWHFRQDMPTVLPASVRCKDNWLRGIKAEIAQKCRSLSIVSLSSAEDVFFSRSQAFMGRPHTVIPNSIDGSIFKPDDGDEVRKELGIRSDATVILFVAQHVDERRKGLADLFEALARIGRKNLAVICVGRGNPPSVPEGIRFFSLGHISDSIRLSRVFSAATIFATPSQAETFGKTTTEALACGIPVVSYPNSGAMDIVGPEDGVLADGFSPPALESAIRSALEKQFNAKAIRQRVLARFSNETIVRSYLQLYMKDYTA